jgi:hypothetical protein
MQRVTTQSDGCLAAANSTRRENLRRGLEGMRPTSRRDNEIILTSSILPLSNFMNLELENTTSFNKFALRDISSPILRWSLLVADPLLHSFDFAVLVNPDILADRFFVE